MPLAELTLRAVVQSQYSDLCQYKLFESLVFLIVNLNWYCYQHTASNSVQWPYLSNHRSCRNTPLDPSRWGCLPTCSSIELGAGRGWWLAAVVRWGRRGKWKRIDVSLALLPWNSILFFELKAEFNSSNQGNERVCPDSYRRQGDDLGSTCTSRRTLFFR